MARYDRDGSGSIEAAEIVAIVEALEELVMWERLEDARAEAVARAAPGSKQRAGDAAVERIEAMLLAEHAALVSDELHAQEGPHAHAHPALSTTNEGGAHAAGHLAVALADAQLERAEEKRMAAAKAEARLAEEAAEREAAERAAEEARVSEEREAAARREVEQRVAERKEAADKAAAERAAAAKAAEERAVAARAKAAELRAAAEQAAAKRAQLAREREAAEAAAKAEIEAQAERAAAARARRAERKAAEERAQPTTVWRECPVCGEFSSEPCAACTIHITIPAGTPLGCQLGVVDAEQRQLVWPRGYTVYVEDFSFPNSFGEVSGLHFGMAIVSVNGASTHGKGLDEVVEHFKAAAGGSCAVSLIPLAEVSPEKEPAWADAGGTQPKPSALWACQELHTGRQPAPTVPFDPALVGTCTRHGLKPVGGAAEAKANQDRGLVCWPFNGSRAEALCVVLDGHGQLGERVSHFCMRHLPRLVEKDAEALRTSPAAALRQSFVKLDQQLSKCKQIVWMDWTGVLSLAPTVVQYAGTTCTAVYMRGSRCWVACSGDSRCVLGSLQDGHLTARDLSRDHKPDDPEERKRLERAGGTVTEAGPKGKPPSRVYTSGPDRHGIAMSRSIGDMAMRKVGVIPEPDVQQFELSLGTGQDRFIIVASDGVWEFISSQEACEIVAKLDDAAAACEALVREAQVRWRLHLS